MEFIQPLMAQIVHSEPGAFGTTFWEGMIVGVAVGIVLMVGWRALYRRA